MIGGKRHIGLAGYPPTQRLDEIPLPLADHQLERIGDDVNPDGVALNSMAHPGSVYHDLDPDAIIEDEIDLSSPMGAAIVTGIHARLDELRAELHAEIQRAPDAQFARSLLDFNERLTRIEKQIAFMSSAQALQERQLMLHKRATGLDMAIKACGPGQMADDITSLAQAFVVWLEPGVSG